jgi:hypothetical protein
LPTGPLGQVHAAVPSRERLYDQYQSPYDKQPTTLWDHPQPRGSGRSSKIGTARHPLVWIQRWRISWRLGKVWYADRLHDDHRRRTPKEATAVFAELGLTGPFWDMGA